MTTPVDVDELTEVTAAAARIFTKPPRRTAALTYLRQRGIDTRSLPDQWPLGYAPPGWTRLVDALRPHFSEQALLGTGLAHRSSHGSLIDAFRDRVIFPVRDNTTSAVVGFIGRDLSGHPDAPKYLNSRTSPVYAKNELLYGAAEQVSAARRESTRRQPVVAEGVLDVLAIVTRARRDDRTDLLPLAASGTAFTTAHAAQVGEIAFANHSSVVLALDSDPAGRTAALRAGEQLRRLGIDTHLAQLPPGADPTDYLLRPDSTLDAFTTTHSVPLLTAQVEHDIAAQGDRMQWIEGRLAAGRVIANRLASYPAGFAAAQVGWIANALQLDAGTFTRELANAYTVAADRHRPISPIGRASEAVVI